MKRQVFLSKSEQRTREIAEALGRTLRPGDCVCLHGDLGAGKTRFVGGLAKACGIDPDDVSSPTFVICQEYEHPGGVVLAHIDAYRLSGEDELETIGWDELRSDPRTVLAVEWPERIVGALPEERIDVTLDHRGLTQREITIEVPASLADRVLPTDTSSACPICQQPAPADASTFPFCSERCRLVDLGRWFGGAYTVSRPIDSDDLED